MARKIRPAWRTAAIVSAGTARTQVVVAFSPSSFRIWRGVSNETAGVPPTWPNRLSHPPSNGSESSIMAGHVAEFTDANWTTEVMESPIPVLVDFWAPWCGPCRTLAPTIEKLAAEFEGRVKVGKMNTDENPNIPGGLRISAIPTVILFHEGKVVDRLVGVTPEGKFRDVLAKINIQ